MRLAYSFQLAAGAALFAAAALSAANAAPLGGNGIRSADRSALVRVNDGYDAYDRRRPRRYHRRHGPVVDNSYAYVDAGDPVIVDAPFTHVGVHRNHVRVIAPFVNLWIPR